MERFAVTPRDAIIHRFLSSRACMRLFNAPYSKGRMNISALARRAGCTNRRVEGGSYAPFTGRKNGSGGDMME
ncbi:hypothetical protein J7L27_01305 [Candidatus Bathyarchaeota archaeon]|nr:hypothetical protein [Candidatus Bathyarchaeota archaeon]